MGYCLWNFKNALAITRMMACEAEFHYRKHTHNAMLFFNGPEDVGSTRKYDLYDFALDLLDNFIYIWSGEHGYELCREADQRMLDNAY